jgi:CheY-like chemotaxis protein
LRKDQSKINVAITLSPIKNRVGAVVGVSKIVRDITKQKEEQEKLRLFAILESKSKEMGQFAYVASHDLREPLLTIKNYVELFIDDYGTTVKSEPKRYLNSILKAVNRMDNLIQALLDYSRLSKVKQLQEVDCNEIIEQVMDDLSSTISKTKAVIRTEPLPVIKAFPLELKVLFLTSKINNDNPKPDIIFLDINMPRMNGWEFLKQYEKLSGDIKSPVIIRVTTSLNPDDKDQAQSFSCVKGFENKYLDSLAVTRIFKKYFPGYL